MPTESDEPVLKSIVPRKIFLGSVHERAVGRDLALGMLAVVVADEVDVDLLRAAGDIAHVRLEAARVAAKLGDEAVGIHIPRAEEYLHELYPRAVGAVGGYRAARNAALHGALHLHEAELCVLPKDYIRPDSELICRRDVFIHGQLSAGSDGKRHGLLGVLALAAHRDVRGLFLRRGRLMLSSGSFRRPPCSILSPLRSRRGGSTSVGSLLMISFSIVRSLLSADAALHLKADEVVHLNGVLHRQLLGDIVGKAADYGGRASSSLIPRLMR